MLSLTQTDNEIKLPDLRIEVDRTGKITYLRLMSEDAPRRPASVRMTFDHPFMVKFLGDYILIDTPHYMAGLMVYEYRKAQPAPAPVLSPETAADDGNSWGGDSEPVELPPALSPEAEAAADLKAQYPHLAGRIEAALALVEAGQTNFPKYQTTNLHSNGGRDNRDCQCPDAEYRGFRTEFGIACKHTLAQEIVDRARRTVNRLVINELEKQQDARRRLLPADVGTGKSILDYLDYGDLADTYASPASYRQPADPLNVKRGHYTPGGAYRPAGK